MEPNTPESDTRRNPLNSAVPRPKASLAASLTASLLLAAVVALCWLGSVDAPARAQTKDALENTLISYALARTLNGVISVAQGTEIAIQPAGVGVVLTAGQILDPLNDLIERFSWIVLMAASSLALQLLLGDLVTTPFMNTLTTLAAVACAALWWTRDGVSPTWRAGVYRITIVLLAMRFALAATGFAMGALGSGYLDEREQDAVALLSDTSAAIERPDSGLRPPRTGADSLLDHLDEFIAAQKESLDIDRRLVRLQRQIEAAVNEVINLIVVYLLKTIIIPLAVLAGVWGIVRQCWRVFGHR